MQQHTVLLNDIDTSQPMHGQADIWWLGQSGYAIKTTSLLIYIDLYLSDHLTHKYADTEKPHIRITETPLHGSEIVNAQWIFASHKHSDHLDPETLPDLLHVSPLAKLVLPAAIVEHAIKLGIKREQLVPTSGDETIKLGPMLLTVIPSAHPTFEFDPSYGYPFIGFCIQIGDLRIYHSGDTLSYNGLAERLRQFKPDIMFLPINGTDERRNYLKVPPNMNALEALTLAQQVGTGLVIPHHYDMFTFNTANVQEFSSLAQSMQIPHKVLRVGEKYSFRKSV